MFLSAFKDPFVLVLALLMVISFFTGDYEAVVVMGIMILASVTITFVQEYRSQKASLALKELIENRGYDSGRCYFDLDKRFIYQSIFSDRRIYAGGKICRCWDQRF